MKMKEKKVCRVFLLDFNFRTYVGILSRISLKNNWSLKLSQKASELTRKMVPIMGRASS